MERTRKLLILSCMLLLSLSSDEQTVLTGNHRKAGSTVCIPPTGLVSQWAAWNPANRCGTSPVACTNGAFASGGGAMPDLITATHNDATSTATNIVYNTGATPSGQPAWTLVAANATHFQPNANLPTTGSITYYVVQKITTHCVTTVCAMFGGGPFGNNYPEFAIGTKQFFQSSGVLVVGIGTTTITAGVWRTSAMTYNFSTGAYAFYICSGGTCTVDGSGTQTSTFAYPNSTFLGANQPTSEYFDGQIAEWGYRTTADVSGIGAWSFCWYGI